MYGKLYRLNSFRYICGQTDYIPGTYNAHTKRKRNKMYENSTRHRFYFVMSYPRIVVLPHAPDKHNELY